MCCPNQGFNFPDIELTLNEPEPSNEIERQLVEEVSANIIKTPELLEFITNYKGCEDSIRDALSNPGDEEKENTAFDAVSDVVEILEKFYNFSLQIMVIWPKLLGSICSENPLESIGNQQATIKQLSELFKFVFLFDNEKIMHPSIQNDFAYYRRVFS